MRYGSVCSGIEAATVAWHPLGWQPAFFSEIDKFPRAVLQHHYPNIPLHGDFTTIKGNEYGAIDLLVGGTPCQSFSIAGLRKGFSDERGNLTLEFIKLAQRIKPKWLVWENVPGVLSQDGGRAFATFLGALAECGYGFAYRILDAQYFGVPQRRRRVFVIGYFGDWRPAAEVLFERESLLGYITPRRKEGEKVAATITRGFGDRGVDADQIANGNCVYSNSGFSNYKKEQAVGTLRARDYKGDASLVCYDAYNSTITGEVTKTLDTGSDYHHVPNLFSNKTIRRLTPLECERLQGFPDNYTNIPNASDSNRYKTLGNSMAVPCMRWIGERINLINGINYEA